MSDKINELRAEIDVIDKELVELLNRRFDACVAIGEEKKKNDGIVFDPAREQRIMTRLNAFSEYGGMVDAIWPHIMAFSKSLQK